MRHVSEGSEESTFDRSAARHQQNLLMFAQFKCIQPSGARRARRENVDSWHRGGCVRQDRKDQRSLFVENFVAVAMMPVDLVRAAVDQCSGKQRGWLACC